MSLELPELTDADLHLQDLLLQHELLSQRQIKQVLAAREQAWHTLCRQFDGVFCIFEDSALQLVLLPENKELARFELESGEESDAELDSLLGEVLKTDLAAVGVQSERGELLQSIYLDPEQNGLLITQATSYLITEDPSRAMHLLETYTYQGHPHFDLFVSPRRDLLLVSERIPGRLHAISLSTYQKLATFELRKAGSDKAFNLAITPRGTRAFVCTQEDESLHLLDLTSLRVSQLPFQFGTLGNLCLAPDPGFIYLTVVAPIFRLLYVQLETLEIVAEFDVRGYPHSLRRNGATDPMHISSNHKYVFLLSAEEVEEEEMPVLHTIATESQELLSQTQVRCRVHPQLIASAYPSPIQDFEVRRLEDWILELGMLSAQNLLRLRQSLSQNANQHSRYDPPQGDEAPQDLLSREAPPITLPEIAEELLLEFMIRAFFQEHRINLREEEERALKPLLREIPQVRKDLEHRYVALVEIEQVLGRHLLQTLITREALLQELDARLGGRELPFRPAHRCPMCQAGLQNPRHCHQCGFELDDPDWKLRRDKQSLEACSELIPGQMLIALPHVGQLVLLNAWHQVIQEWKADELEAREPMHATALPNGHYLVADKRGKQVFELSPDGERIRTLGHAFKEPVALSFYRQDDGQQRWLVVDRKAPEVLEFTPDGTLLRSLGRAEGLQLKAPCDVQRTWAESFLITDPGGQAVYEVAPSGKVLDSWDRSLGLKKPVLGRRRLNGDTLIIDAGLGEVRIYGKQKQLVKGFRYWPPPDAEEHLQRQPAPDRFLVLSQSDIIALGRHYWMQLNLTFERARWIKPWTGEHRPERLKSFMESIAGESTLIKMLRRVSFLRQAETSALQLLAEYLDAAQFAAGQWITHQGELGNELYVLSQGEVDFYKDEKKEPVASLESGQIFGEMAMILSEPREISARAKTDCHLWMLDRADFKKVVVKFPDLAKFLRELARKRKSMFQQMENQQQQDVMRRVKAKMAVKRLQELGFFERPEPGLLERIADSMQPLAFMPGQELFRQGESGDTLYFISRGSVAIYLDESKEPVAQLEAGEIIGEMSVLTDAPRSATVTSTAYCQFFVLERQTLDQIAQDYPRLRAELREISEQRQQENERARELRAAQQVQEEIQSPSQVEDSLDGLLQDDDLFASTVIMDRETLMSHLQLPPADIFSQQKPRPLMAYGFSVYKESVLALNQDGQILWSCGPQEKLGLYQPTRMNIQERTVWIADTGNNRVLAVHNGEITLELGPPLVPLLQPRSVFPTAGGQLLIADEGNQRLLLLSEHGEILWEYGAPYDILSPYYAELTSKNTVLYADRALHMVYEVNPHNNEVLWSYGSLLMAGEAEHELNEPACVRRLSNGGTLIVDTGNERLLLISPVGTLMRTMTGTPEIPLHGPIHCEPLDTGDFLIYADHAPELIRMAMSGHPIWRARFVV